MAKRVFEIRHGKLYLATHLYQGYRFLLQQGPPRAERFRLIGITSLLRQRFGQKTGYAIYVSLRSAKLIRTYARARATGKSGNFHQFIVYRRAVARLPIDYHPRRSNPHGRRKGHRQPAKIDKVVDFGIRTSKRRTRQPHPQSSLPASMVTALLVHAGRQPGIRPTRIEIHFFFPARPRKKK